MAIVTIHKPPAANPGIEVDFDAIGRPMQEALQRVYSFLGYADRTTSGEPLASVSLNHAIVYDVGIPDPIPENERIGHQREYRRWVIGLGLTEIDQSYQRYLVSALQTVADIDSWRRKGNTAAPIKEPPNTWEAHKDFYRACGRPLGQNTSASYLKSLKDARNCLVHGSGLVRARHLNQGKVMQISWPGSDILARPPNAKKALPVSLDQPYQKLEAGEELSIVEVVRSKSYHEGEQIELSAADLAEIHFFYRSLAMEAGKVLHKTILGNGARLAQKKIVSP